MFQSALTRFQKGVGSTIPATTKYTYVWPPSLTLEQALGSKEQPSTILSNLRRPVWLKRQKKKRKT